MGEERQQVLSIYERLLEAWNRRDPDAFASLFGETGSSVGFDGSPMNGQTEIAATLRAIFADHQTAAYVAKLREIRSLGSGVTLLRAVVGMIPPGKTELNPAANAIQSLVVVTEAAQPRIALLHNTPAAFHGRPHMVEQLTDELTEVVRQRQLVAEAGQQAAAADERRGRSGRFEAIVTPLAAERQTVTAATPFPAPIQTPSAPHGYPSRPCGSTRGAACPRRSPARRSARAS
jgi:uncharacterized protein (TIGR02246 family)